MGDIPILSKRKVDELLKLSDSIVEECLKRYMFLLSIADGLNYVQNHSENKVQYSPNVFERYDSNELTTSWAMSRILEYKDGDDYPLLKLFTDKFLVPKGFNPKWIEKPVITAGKDRVDICVKDNKYAIVFENKVKGASYQPNQIARYIYKLKSKHYNRDNIFIVLMKRLDNDYIPKSTWRLPEDHRKPKREHRCVTGQGSCWCDHRDEQRDSEFCKSSNKTFWRDYYRHTVALRQELSEWLIKDCVRIIPEKEIILKSFVIQFADFLNLQYGTRENPNLKREMEK